MIIREVVIFLCRPYRYNRSRTVRYAFPLLFIVASVLGASVIDSETQSYVRIESSTNTVKEGELFEIFVYASAHTPINAVNVELAFPATQVEITGIDTGESVITLWTEQPSVIDNTVVLRGGTFRKGFLGDHLIATVNAKAKATGVASFEVADTLFLAGDGSGTEVAVSESGQESTTLYIADETGALSVSPESESGIEALVTLRIVTDIDGDGAVTLADVSRFMSAWNSKAEIFDFSGDGKMTFRDFAIILAHSFTR